MDYQIQYYELKKEVARLERENDKLKDQICDMSYLISLQVRNLIDRLVDPSNEAFWTLKRTAKYFGVSIRTIYTWAKKDRIKLISLGFNITRVDVNSIQRFIDEGRKSSPFKNRNRMG